MCCKGSLSLWRFRLSTSSAAHGGRTRRRWGRSLVVPGYHDVTRYSEAAQLDRSVIFRFDAPLIFVNARTFRELVTAFAHRDPKPDWIIVAAEPITDIDTTACEMLADLISDLDARGVRLVFAELKDPVRAKVRKFGLDTQLDDSRVFPTLTIAVKECQLATCRKVVATERGDSA